jgi:DNA-binding LytR/AlgR family response regulator
VRAQAATDAPAVPDWQLLEMPAGMELTSPSALLPLVSLFDRLPMESARAASVVDGLQAQHVIAMSTTDGLHILAETYATDAAPYVRFTITADPAAPAAPEPAAADTTGEQTGNSGAAIAATYRARVEGFVFTLPEFKASVFEKRVADLTRAVATETDRAPEAP